MREGLDAGERTGRSRAVKATSAVVALLALAGCSSGADKTSASKKKAASATTTTVAPKIELTDKNSKVFHDDQWAFSIRYPKSWTQIPPPGGQELVLRLGDTADLVSIRVTQTDAVITAANLGDVKAFTDGVVGSGNVRVLQQRAVSVNGMPGYYYLYNFTDTDSGQQGVHAHYFLFQGRKMQQLVFQALPVDDFTKLAGIFDAVVNSFQSEKDKGGPPPSTTSTTAK